MEGQKFWKSILRYGHVGRKHEVSVARFICTEEDKNALDVMEIVSGMPGVKNRGVVLVTEIDEVKYLAGKKKESENLYLKELMSFKPRLKGGTYPCA